MLIFAQKQPKVAGRFARPTPAARTRLGRGSSAMAHGLSSAGKVAFRGSIGMSGDLKITYPLTTRLGDASRQRS
jgi:hypothetical protein